MPRRHLGPFHRARPYIGRLTTFAARTAPDRHPSPGALFSTAYATYRPCRCNSCIVLTREERAYERRVFRLAKSWSRMLEASRETRRTDVT